MTLLEQRPRGRGEKWLRENTKSSAIRRTAGLILDFDLLGEWGLNDSQVEQLKLHLAAAIVRQEGHNDSYLAKRPEVQAARNVPVVGRILNFLVFDSDNANRAVEAELLQEARLELTNLSQRAGKQIASQVADRSGFDRSEVEDVLAENWFEGEIADVLKLREIQRAANLIASAYTAHKEDPDALRRNMAGILPRFDFHR